MSRHPYTYACDYIRNLAGYGDNGTKLSRSDASKVRQGIAAALGMDDAELACKLSDYFQANEPGLNAQAMRGISEALGLPVS